MAQSFSSSACGGSPPAKRVGRGSSLSSNTVFAVFNPHPLCLRKGTSPNCNLGKKEGGCFANAICLHRLNSSLYVKEWHDLFLPPLTGEVRPRSGWEGGVAYLQILCLLYLTPIPFACAKVLPPITIEGRKRLGHFVYSGYLAYWLSRYLYFKGITKIFVSNGKTCSGMLQAWPGKIQCLIIFVMV